MVVEFTFKPAKGEEVEVECKENEDAPDVGLVSPLCR